MVLGAIAMIMILYKRQYHREWEITLIEQSIVYRFKRRQKEMNYCDKKVEYNHCASQVTNIIPTISSCHLVMEYQASK